MKKQYSIPEMKIVNLDQADVICTSIGFGNGTTSNMRSREFYEGEDN